VIGGAVEHGDISNEVAPRIIFVFEGLIGQLASESDEKKHRALVKVHAWKRAASMWTFDGWARKIIWDYTSRRLQQIDIVTYLDEREAEHIHDRIDAAGIPYGNFWATTMQEFVSLQMLNPAVIGVVDGDNKRWGVYGSKSYNIGRL
jgi:hypothetical protein